MNNPKFITFTGADDRTDYRDMVELGRAYPVEFGILMSPAQVGGPRYPSPTWTAGLRDHEGLSLSAHICGGYARHCRAKGTLGWSLAPLFAEVKFCRMQINGPTEGIDLGMMVDLSRRAGSKIILQSTDQHTFPKEEKVEWLFDVSGGKGLEPETWPMQKNPLQGVGYAGGLSPDNISNRIEIFRTLATNYWIDMESGVRDSNDRFDIKKCWAVCQAVYGDPE